MSTYDCITSSRIQRVSKVSTLVRALPVILGCLALSVASVPTSALADELPGCLRIRTESRLHNGLYDHVVLISSTCSRQAICTVATDLAPKPRTVLVGPSETSETVMLIGARTPAFAPSVSCIRSGAQ